MRKYDHEEPVIYLTQGIKRVAVLPLDDSVVTDLIIQIIIKYSNWKMISIDIIKVILDELEFQVSGFVDPQAVKRIGIMVGVDMIMYGTLNSDSIVVKTIAIETAEYLVFEVVKHNTDCAEFIVRMATTTLLPYSIRFKGGQPLSVITGNNADKFK